jgi:CubicO group peptidase (beta-lactamase class C family)
MLYLNQLDAVLQEIVSGWGIPGMAIGIVSDREILYTRTFGVQNIQTQVPVTSTSIFCVTSMSKCFVAAAVMQLVERGRIDLDGPLVKYLPYVKMADDRYQQVTIRQMLSHTSGMPDMSEHEYKKLLAHQESDEGAAKRYVLRLRDRCLEAAPGERFLYSNIAYNVLGAMITTVSGMPFETYMKENILLPARMMDSTFLLGEVPASRLAVPHLRAPGLMVSASYPYNRADAPASFLHATLVDMCHWLMTCLNRGNSGSGSLLSPAGFEKMWTPVAKWGFPPFYEDVGLGWTLGHYRGAKTVSHGGMGFGWTDFLTLLPDRNMAMVILCNEESSARSRTLRAVADTMLDQKPAADTISWMVPVSQALEQGGVKAARACYVELKVNRAEEFDFDEDDLLNLTYQLEVAGKIDLALEVLGFNLEVYPKHVASIIQQAKLHYFNGSNTKARKCLMTALTLEPENVEAKELLSLI